MWKNFFYDVGLWFIIKGKREMILGEKTNVER